MEKQMLFRRVVGGLVGLSMGLTLAVAQAQSKSVGLKVDTINSSLQSPWGLAFLPDGRMLVTERGGVLKLLLASGQTQGALDGVPAVNSAGQGGLLDVVIDPAFATNQRIYLSYSENDAANPSLNGTAVARARLDLVANQLRDVRVIYRQLPKVNSR
jgi:glucose/arabinose dehydrogenase